MPTNLSMLLNLGRREITEKITSLEFILCSAAPLSPALQEEFERAFGIPLVEGYGLTEAGSYSTCNLATPKGRFKPGKSDEFRVVGSVGVPIGNEVRIVDPQTGVEMEAGEVGEIIISGPNVMKGYVNDPQATRETVRNGWLYTGDLGCLDDRGYYYIRGRKKDIIIHGGQKVFAREVEDVLYRNPKVRHAAIVPVPDKIWGENVKAIIVLRDNCSTTEREIMEYCEKYLAKWKCPEIVQFAAEVPLGPSGKILKTALAGTEE
jgi:long-chain acyl-CoA synthetase